MKKSLYYLSLIAVLLFVSCSSDDDNTTSTETVAVETINVDIIVPNDVKPLWQPAIDLALENIGAAQKGLPKQVKLNLRYHDEQAANLQETLYSLCYPKEGTDTCHLIIGPTDIDHARMTLSTADLRRVPVVMPTVAGDELQRIYADSPYAFFLTESNATQCEVLLSFLGTAKYINRGALVYSDDTYGQSFRNWFGFMATEFKFNVTSDDIRPYTSGSDLTAWLTSIEREMKTSFSHYAIVFAINNVADIKSIISQIRNVRSALNLQPDDDYVTYYFTDHSDTDDVLRAGLSLYGFAPTSAPASGFDVAYEKRYGIHPAHGCAQVYDALTTAALAASKRMNNPSGPDHLILDGSPVESKSDRTCPNLGDWMRALVADKSGTVTTWTPDGLLQAFRLISQGKAPAVTGATGALIFDEKVHNSILQTTYQLWRTDGKGERYPLMTFSTSGDNAAAGTTPIWNWEKYINDDFDRDVVWDSKLPATTDHWALLVSTSTKWSDYRHQADVLAMYQLLLQHGYDADHIVLVCEDNLKDDENNQYPGKIYVETPGGAGGDDVRAGAQPDYRFSDLDIEDIGRIILGDTDGGRLPHVFHTTSTSDVLIFWSGHGSDGRGMVWDNPRQNTAFTGQRMHDIISQLNNRDGYRRCMLAIETCFSGLIGKAVEGLPDVVAITAANDLEPSKADVFDHTLGVFLSNAFSRSFRQAVNNSPDITLRDLYYSLARTTAGSHVSLYNDINYGSVYSLTARDYFPR